MLAAETRAARAHKSIRIAVVISLALHAVALFFHLLLPMPPAGGDADSRFIVRSPLNATLPKRAQTWQVEPTTPQTPAKTSREKNPKAERGRILTSPSGKWAVGGEKSRSSPPTPSGSQLAQEALAMARGMGSEELDGGPDKLSTRQDGKGKNVEPFSLQMYYDSFIKKLNRSAAFVRREPRLSGNQKALVEIIINPDGSLKEYKVLRAADQASEIAYIKSVVDMAVPFAAFPPDIRGKAESLSLRICINPPGLDGGSGFSRSSSGRDC